MSLDAATAMPARPHGATRPDRSPPHFDSQVFDHSNSNSLSNVPASQSHSHCMRDLPQFSQDTLALLPRFVKEHQVTRYGPPAARPSSEPTTRQDPMEATPGPPSERRDLQRPHSNSEDGVARASLQSALCNAPPLQNPFVAEASAGPSGAVQTARTSNASESFQNMDSLLESRTTDSAHDMDERRDDADSRDASLHASQRAVLKLMVVSCQQARARSADFDMRSLAGRGAFSHVWRAVHRLDGCQYAIKRNNAPLTNESARLDALKEVFALSACQGHPNVLRFCDVWFEEKGEFLHMRTEYLPHGNLQSLYVDARRPMPLADLFALAEDMASALEFMHGRGMAHVDVKPDNIFQADRHLDRPSFVIGDFGLACERFGTGARNTEGDSRYLCPEALAGFSGTAAQPTAVYMSDEGSRYAPGRRMASRSADKSVADTPPRRDLCKGDVYSLGASLYELAMGMPLDKSGSGWKRLRECVGEAVEQVHVQCGSRQMADLIGACLRADPNERASASEIKKLCQVDKDGRCDELAARNEELRARLRQADERIARFESVISALLAKGEEGRSQYRNRHARKPKSRRGVLNNCRD